MQLKSFFGIKTMREALACKELNLKNNKDKRMKQINNDFRIALVKRFSNYKKSIKVNEEDNEESQGSNINNSQEIE
jgi:LPS O-antigen subunit length determinant protein (WzzB/FepE family)